MSEHRHLLLLQHKLFTRWKDQPGNYRNLLSQLLAQWRWEFAPPRCHTARSPGSPPHCQFLPYSSGTGQEAYGALQLRVRTLQWKHESEPAANYSSARGNMVSPYSRNESLAPLQLSQCRRTHPAAKHPTTAYQRDYTTRQQKKYFQLSQCACALTIYKKRLKKKKKSFGTWKSVHVKTQKATMQYNVTAT